MFNGRYKFRLGNMDRILFLFFISLVSIYAHADFCNWGFVGPKRHKCNGETYYYGTAACSSGFYQNIFCHERFNQDGRACGDDNSPDTVECYNSMVKPGRVEPRQDEDEGFCNWGFAGPKVITCEGEKFCFGSAACRNGIYSNIFCNEQFCQSAKQCSHDNAAKTVRCYNRFIQTEPSQSVIGAGQREPSRVGR